MRNTSISLDDINTKYSQFNSVKTTENCQNMTFAGGVENEYELYKTLEKLSLFITPRLSNEENIGNLSHNYIERFNQQGGNEYYNVDNIYYKLGYWDQEIYRLGIVYILNDYTLSPVFNIRGIKELSYDTVFNLPEDLYEEITYQEDYTIEGTDHNSKGVFKINADTPYIWRK